MKKQLIIIIIGAFFLSGCAYGPSMTDIPLISEKGEMRLNAGYVLILEHTLPCLTALQTKSLCKGMPFTKPAFLMDIQAFKAQLARFAIFAITV